MKKRVNLIEVKIFTHAMKKKILPKFDLVGIELAASNVNGGGGGEFPVGKHFDKTEMKNQVIDENGILLRKKFLIDLSKNDLMSKGGAVF